MRTPPRDFDMLDENVGRLLLLSFRIFERSLVRYMTELGFAEIRMSHLGILRNVRPEGTRTTEIADLANVTKQTVTALTNELEAARYIIRSADPSDGRAKLVRFAPRGDAFMKAFPTALQMAESDIIADIGATSFEALRSVLIRMVSGKAQGQAR